MPFKRTAQNRAFFPGTESTPPEATRSSAVEVMCIRNEPRELSFWGFQDKLCFLVQLVRRVKIAEVA